MVGEWIEWEGGECPVNPDTRVEVKFRDGGREGSTPASYWADGGDVFNCWKHADTSSDIIAYRVVRS